MINLILREIKRSGYDGLIPAGLVLTGGTARLTGLRDLARQMTHLPVRVGAPAGIPALPDELRTPDNATGVGMLTWALKGQWVAVEHGERRQRSPLLDRIMRWLQNLLPD
ncbi:MAG: hypothetical protein R2844_07950 [Caldilineales bacterium]